LGPGEIEGPAYHGAWPRPAPWESRCQATADDLEQCLTDLHYNLYGVFLTAPMCDDICRAEGVPDSYVDVDGGTR
jgi:hypothetical protein